MNKKKRLEQLNAFRETYLKDEYKKLKFYVVLVSPEHSGNIGSIARVMKNFNYQNLLIFNPVATIENILSYETKGFAMHGKDILLNAEIISLKEDESHLTRLKNLLKKFDMIIGTTAKGGKYINIKRIPIFPQDIILPFSEKPLNVAILFGKESRGLTNDEIRMCDLVVRIPSNNEYPTLNLSHACGIILYELFKKRYTANIGRGNKPVIIADREDRLVFYNLIEELIKKIKIKDFRQGHAITAFKNIFERSLMSKKELGLILGFFSRINKFLEKFKIFDEEKKNKKN